MFPSALLVIFNIWVLILILMQSSVGFSSVPLICVADLCGFLQYYLFLYSELVGCLDRR